MTMTRTLFSATALAVALTAAQSGLSQLSAESPLASLGLSTAQAQEQEERETRKTPALRNSVYEKLSEAQTAAEEKDLATAQQVLNEMIADRGRNELNSYELANVYNLMAFIHYSREDYASALQAYENVVSQPDIPLAMEINTRYTVAQLHFVQENWREGIDALLKWFDMSENAPANAYVLLAQGYYQLEDYPKSLENVETAIEIYREKDKTPKEQWYNLARFLYTDRGDVDSALAVLEELLTHYPKKDYWVQLGYMYSEKGNEKRQLGSMETAYVQDMLDKDGELRNLASLYLSQGVPYKAGKVLEKGFEDGLVEDDVKNYELLAGSWRQAQEVEKAIPVMETAASKSDSGELYSQLGNIYLDGDQFEKAVDAINTALQRGGVKRPDTARLVLGMAHFNLEEYEQAREAFRAAGRDERSEQYAKQWIRYMDSEIDRQQKLAEG
ncbi:tetratricopeptide repeat protein [Chromatocurvus halotolerans]|uniref:TolA-binding protein n=1 Tax=Chromatocurvus halotolerans TaxID=1132028 RepID=A0A4R2KYK4_9GAMM|nr:tetratricopeptide repeat protein [Chromatocurvus halotolerans]TCO75358.1 TolA-binding protein [Chromatocurvus halotolerans]